MWKTYKEVYEEVLQIGSALRAVGAEPVNIVFIFLFVKSTHMFLEICSLYRNKMFLCRGVEWGSTELIVLSGS